MNTRYGQRGADKARGLEWGTRPNPAGTIGRPGPQRPGSVSTGADRRGDRMLRRTASYKTRGRR